MNMTDERKEEIRLELGVIGRVWLWLLGRPICGLKSTPNTNGTIRLYKPDILWKVNVCHKTWVYTQCAPNAFHRGMQRLAFGVRWYCVV
jgi:hypothetical protein